MRPVVSATKRMPAPMPTMRVYRARRGAHERDLVCRKRLVGHASKCYESDMAGDMERGASWANMVFWTVILMLVAAGGAYIWRYVNALPDQERTAQCTRSCHAMHAEFVDVTRYGCFCQEQDIPFVLEAGQIGVDCE